jgi:hypothetical protein
MSALQKFLICVEKSPGVAETTVKHLEWQWRTVDRLPASLGGGIEAIINKEVQTNLHLQFRLPWIFQNRSSYS